MGRKAASQIAVKRKLQLEQDKRMQEACEDYALDQQNPDPLARKSFKTLALLHKVPMSTLAHRIKGRQSLATFNADKQKLTPAEESVLVDHLLHMASRGLPLTHRMLDEKASAILRVHWGLTQSGATESKHLELSKAWSRYFLNRHQNLQVYWSKPLERVRASGLNPTAVKEYFDAVEAILGDGAIPPENQYGVDESGFNTGLQGRQKVIGARGKKGQHSRSEGKRENITVMETICADGTSLEPIIIFKASKHQASWGERNPCNARITYSAKGYTDNELGVEYIQDFHLQTVHKNNLWRVLFVDGHQSHCTLEFLEFARNNNIHVICYPPHTTHALQGLDVACFGPLKLRWAEAKNTFEKNKKRRIEKDDFAEIYAHARNLALIPSTIHAAFRATGIYPLDRSVITQEQTAPSLVTSTHGGFPGSLPTPVQCIAEAFRTRHYDRQQTPTPSSAPGGSNNTNSLSEMSQRVNLAANMLSETSASFLVAHSPVKSSHALPPIAFQSLTQNHQPDYSVLDAPLPSPTYKELEDAYVRVRTELEKARAYNQEFRLAVERGNAQQVLLVIHIDSLTKVLYEREAAVATKKGKKGRRKHRDEVGGIYKRVMTSDELIAAAQLDMERDEEEKRKAEEAKREKEKYGTKTAWKKQDVSKRKRKRDDEEEGWKANGKKGPKPKLDPPTKTPDYFKRRKVASGGGDAEVSAVPSKVCTGGVDVVEMGANQVIPSLDLLLHPGEVDSDMDVDDGGSDWGGTRGGESDESDDDIDIQEGGEDETDDD